MNKEEPYRDQAERLKKRIQKINDKVETGDREKYPPREQVHRKKKKKTKWKLKYPIIRLLVLCFILLPVIIFSVISYRENGKKLTGTEKTSGSSVGYETINLETSGQQDENAPEKTENTNQGSNKPGTTEKKQEDTKVESEQSASSENTKGETQGSIEETANVKVSDKAVQQPSDAGNSQSNTNTTEQSNRVLYHTVKQEDTLFKLAIRYYKSKIGIEIIKNANNLQGESIYAGQVLKIPLNN